MKQREDRRQQPEDDGVDERDRLPPHDPLTVNSSKKMIAIDEQDEHNGGD